MQTQQSSTRASAFVLGGAIASIVSLAFSVLRSKVTAVLVGPTGLGVFAEAAQVVALGLVAGTAAAHTPLLRALARVERGVRAESDAMASAFWATLGLHAVGGVAVVFTAAGWRTDDWSVPVAFAVALCFAASLAATLATIASQYLTAAGSVRGLTVSSSATALLTTLCSVLFTGLLGLPGLFLGLALGAVSSAAMPWILMRSHRGALPSLWPPRVDRPFLMDVWTLGGTALLGGLCQQGLLTVTRWALSQPGGTVGLEANGQYQAALAIVTSYLMMVLSGLVSFYPPRFASAANLPELQAVSDEAATAVLKYVAPLAFLGIGLSRVVMRLFYSSRFDAAVDVLELMLAAAPLRLLSWSYAAMLPMRGRGLPFLMTEVTAIAVGAPAAVLCIEAWGLEGAGIAYLVLYLSYLPITALVLKLSLDVSPRARHAAGAIAATTIGALVHWRAPGSVAARVVLVLLGLGMMWRSGLISEFLAKVRNVINRARNREIEVRS